MIFRVLSDLALMVFAGFFRSALLRYNASAFLKVGALVYAIAWVFQVNCSLAVDVYALLNLFGVVIVIVHILFFTDTIERTHDAGVF